MIHGMIDIETLGTKGNAVILSIGGCKFDPFIPGKFHSKFSVRLDVDEQVEKGRTIDQSTVDWWNRQDQAVYDEAFGDENRMKHAQIIAGIKKWSADCTKMWCQGPSFDFPILKSYFQDFGESDIPWEFWRERDARTIAGFLPYKGRNAAAHSAIADCIASAEKVQRVFQMLGIKEIY